MIYKFSCNQFLLFLLSMKYPGFTLYTCVYMLHDLNGIAYFIILYSDDLMQKRCNANALTTELHLFCIKPSIYRKSPIFASHIKCICLFWIRVKYVFLFAAKNSSKICWNQCCFTQCFKYPIAFHDQVAHNCMLLCMPYFVWLTAKSGCN